MSRVRPLAVVLVVLASLAAAAVARAEAKYGTVEVTADADAVARAAAETFVEVVDRARAEGRIAAVALSGGTTPHKLFSLLATEYRHRVDWNHVEIFFGDERAVGPTHPGSNYGAALGRWLDRVRISPARVHRMKAEQSDIDAAARSYEETLRARVGADEPGGVPRFDLVWLGLGKDGHTASLFPGSPGLRSRRRLVVAGDGADGQRRLSFTGVVLEHARRLQFLVVGPDKAEVLSQVHDVRDRRAIPARLVAARGRGRVEWLVDQAAAARLKARAGAGSSRR